MIKFVPITRYSRCKRYSGTTIKCPNCNSFETIYHLAWTSLHCQTCELSVKKFDWLIDKG